MKLTSYLHLRLAFIKKPISYLGAGSSGCASRQGEVGSPVTRRQAGTSGAMYWERKFDGVSVLLMLVLVVARGECVSLLLLSVVPFPYRAQLVDQRPRDLLDLMFVVVVLKVGAQFQLF
jgi:hypothetical protein